MMKEMSMLQFELSLKSVWKDVHENIFSFKLEVGFHSFVMFAKSFGKKMADSYILKIETEYYHFDGVNSLYLMHL